MVGLDGSDTTEEKPGSPHQEDSPKASWGCGQKELWKHFLLHSEHQPAPRLFAGFINALNFSPRDKAVLIIEMAMNYCGREDWGGWTVPCLAGRCLGILFLSGFH